VTAGKKTMGTILKKADDAGKMASKVENTE